MLSTAALRAHNRRDKLTDSGFKEILQGFVALRDVIGNSGAPDPVFSLFGLASNQRAGAKVLTGRAMHNLIMGLDQCLRAIVEDYNSSQQTTAELHKQGFIFLLLRLQAIKTNIFYRAGIWADATNLATDSIISSIGVEASTSYTISVPMLLKKIAKSVEDCGLIDDKEIARHFRSFSMGTITNGEYKKYRDVLPMKSVMADLDDMVEKLNRVPSAYFKALSSRFKMFAPNSLRGQYRGKSLFSSFDSDRNCPSVIYGTPVVNYLLSSDRTPDEIYEAIDVLSYYGYGGWLNQLNSSTEVVNKVCQNIPACSALLRNASQRFDFGDFLTETASKAQILFTIKVLAMLLIIDLSATDTAQLLDLHTAVKTLADDVGCGGVCGANIKLWLHDNSISLRDFSAQLGALRNKYADKLAGKAISLDAQQVEGGSSGVAFHAALSQQHRANVPVPVYTPDVKSEIASINGL